MSRLRSYARLPRESQKVKDGAQDFKAVYAEVNARSEGRCEFRMELEGQPNMVAWFRCRKRATDHHHLVKPRRAVGSHSFSLIVHLCREHHERCEYPFKRGRLVVTPTGGRGEFTYRIQFAASKFQARGQGE